MNHDRQAFVRWARAAAIPLATTSPDSGLDDLRPLLPGFAAARVVGLGEATHGTREFFQLKHRIVDLLAEHAGLDEFHIEASLPEAMDVDRWVRTGSGDPDADLAGMRFWVWDTDEVLGLLHGLRRRRGRVRFRGVDLQFAPVAVRRLLEVAGAGAADLVADLDPLLDETLADFWRRIEPGARDRAVAALRRLVTRAESVAVDEEESLAVARLAGTVEGWLEMADQPDIWDVRRVRDREMAEHVLGWLGSGRAALWAHNQHVGRDGFGGRFPSMGQHLARKLGAEYVPVGFTFAAGGFQAMDAEDRLVDHTVDEPPPGSFEEALAEVDLPLFVLDLRAAPEAAARWLATKPPTRSIGSGFTGDGSLLEMNPQEQYDVVVHVATTTPARRTPSGSRVPSPRAEPAPALRNLDFAETTGDLAPAGWTLTDARAVGRYAARVVPVDGRPALLVTRASARWRPGKTLLHQRVDAEQWRGSRVRIEGEVRREGHPLDGSVRLLLDAARDGGEGVASASAAATPDGCWTTVSAALDVPADATVLSVAVAVTGNDPGLCRGLTVTVTGAS